MVMVLGLFATICFFWMLVKIWKGSVLLAILAFFFWPVVIVALIKNWGDEETDIKVPFFLWIGSVAIMVYVIGKMEKAMREQEGLLSTLQMLA